MVPVDIFRIMYGVSNLILSISQKKDRQPMTAIMKNRSASLPKRHVIMPTRPFHSAATMNSAIMAIPMT